MCPISDSAIADAIYRGLCTLSQLRRGGLHFRFWSILKVGNGRRGLSRDDSTRP